MGLLVVACDHSAEVIVACPTWTRTTDTLAVVVCSTQSRRLVLDPQSVRGGVGWGGGGGG